MDLIFIVLMTIMIYIVLENNKIKQIFNKMYKLDLELERELKQLITSDNGSGESMDVFTVREIRNMINTKFLLKHKVDDFKIYKESMYKISVILQLGLAVQRLEMITNNGNMSLKEVSIEYSNIDFSKK